jgi:hypothetical protein
MTGVTHQALQDHEVAVNCIRIRDLEGVHDEGVNICQEISSLLPTTLGGLSDTLIKEMQADFANGVTFLSIHTRGDRVIRLN